jgi:hypothetical protein
MNIKLIIKEELTRLPFKFEVGGYLIPCKKQEGTQWLTEEEFQKLKKLNDNIKELYENEVEELRLRKLHHRGVMQKAMDKIKSDPNFNFSSK